MISGLMFRGFGVQAPISFRAINCLSKSMSSSLKTLRFGSIGLADFPNQLKAEVVEVVEEDFSSFFLEE